METFVAWVYKRFEKAAVHIASWAQANKNIGVINICPNVSLRSGSMQRICAHKATVNYGGEKKKKKKQACLGKRNSKI